ncbi:MAG: hypothetical protein ACLQBQ_13310 [Smithella sp.]
MNIKGSSYITAKALVTEAFGEERWNSFITKVVEKDKFFNNRIMAITLMPVGNVIIFLTSSI